MGGSILKTWKRVLTFFLTIVLVLELMPLASYAAEKSILLEIEDIAPREGIQGQKSIFTVTAKDSYGNYISQVPIAFFVDGQIIEEKPTDQTGRMNVSYQFLSAGKFSIGFSANGAENESNSIEMTYTVKETSAMQFTCQNEVRYGSSMVLTTTQKKGTINYKIVAGDGAAYITDALLTATKTGTVTIQASLTNESGQIIDQAEMDLKIQPKEITFTAEASDKIYTGTQEAEYKKISELQGVLEGDEVILLPGNPLFESPDVGPDKKIRIEGAALEGKDAPNYQIVPPHNLSASIEKRTVTIKNAEIADKIYDGTVEASFKKVPGLNNLCEIDKDKVDLILPKIQYKSADAGEKKEILSSFFTLEGEKAANYELEQPEPLFGRIKKAVLTATADDKKRVYGKKNPSFTYTIHGFVKGESEENVKGFEEPKLICSADKNSKPGSYTIHIKGGNAGKNYEFQYENGTLTITGIDGDKPPAKQIVPVKTIHYNVSKPNGKNQWFKKGNFRIKPRLESGFDKISISPLGPWQNELNYTEDTKSRTIRFYLKNMKTGEISKAGAEQYRMDKKDPYVSYEVLTTFGAKATEKKHTAFGTIYESGCYVEINASDAMSGIEQIKYYTVDANTGNKSAIQVEKANNVQVSLPYRFKGYVFATVIDCAGNQMMMVSDGIIVTEGSIGNGNKGETKGTKKKKKDTAAPVIKISYDDTASKGIYYNSPRTAKIQILEYDLGKVSVKIKKDKTERKKVITVTKGKKLYKDKKKNPYYIYTAYITFEENGRYTLDISCKDKAGNKNNGIIYTEGSNALKFIIDKEAPAIKFRQLKAGQSYNGKVQPSFILKDKNLDIDSLTYSICGTRLGEVTVGGKAVTYPGGYLYVLDQIPEEKYDDNYTLTVSVKDKAGNKGKNSIPFRINREGSHYRLDAYTSQVNHTHIKDVSDIVIIESNLDRIKKGTCVFLNYNGITYPLTRSKDYTITCFGDGTGYYEYMYIFSKELFVKNGTYRIVVANKDKAGNKNNNMNQKEAVYFTIDKTGPALIQSNVTNGSVYLANKYKVQLTFKDNIELFKTSIWLNGTKMKGAVTKDNKITFHLKEDISEQNLKITARDMAGNKVTFSYHIYITKNPFIWLIKAKINKKLKFLFLLCFLICIFGIVTLILLVTYYIKEKKRVDL